ncbi:DUF2254 domain-containing protein [Pseudoxanthobacter sp. M-2]|uniref:DUF2254 domain-containing protein n=1 Tax=Pseudoxanthobacter sp. M-2 TaxID=3078754 RepID=UPI0038FCE101
MISKWRFMALRLGRRLWVRAGFFAVLGVATALLAIVAERFIPWELPGKIGADAVDSILNILASSMLAVTTFSLTVMVAAYSAATSNVTPRATRLVMQDVTTQNVLATFLGTFLFSLVGIIALSTGVYGDRGRVVLFVVVLGVIVVIVVALLRWIDHLSRLGRVGETTDRVEKATAAALAGRIETPCLGGRPWLASPLVPPDGAVAVESETVGYVQHVDIGGLSALAEEHDFTVYLAAPPGAFVHDGKPLAWLVGDAVDGDGAGDFGAAVREAFVVDAERSFEQDPRFGLAVLAEIASRALSPAVNDPGTAIDVIGRAVRLLQPWAHRGEPHPEGTVGADDEANLGVRSGPDEDIACPRVHVPPLAVADLLDDVFAPIARDGAGIIEVQMRLQKALIALASMGDDAMTAAALEQSRRALVRAEAALTLPDDVARLRTLLTTHRGRRG